MANKAHKSAAWCREQAERWRSRAKECGQQYRSICRQTAKMFDDRARRLEAEEKSPPQSAEAAARGEG